MFTSISLTIELPVYPQRVYRAWLDSYEHSRFTHAPATITGIPGEAFATLNNQVIGELLVATPFDRIVQKWRMVEFPDNSPDSTVELKLEPTCTGSMVQWTQSGVAPDKTREVIEWWEQKYLQPLLTYFEELVGEYVADMGDG